MLNRVLQATEYAAALFLVGMLLCVAVQIGARFLGMDVAWTEELARAGMVWMTLVGSIALTGFGQHIAVSMIVDNIKGRAGLILRVSIFAVVLGTVAVMLYLSTDLAFRPSVLNQETPLMGLPVFLIYVAAPVSFALMLIGLVGTYRFQISDRSHLVVEKE